MINPFVTLGEGVAQARRVRHQHGIGFATQLRQLRMLRAAAGIGRAEYYSYRLWRPALDDVRRAEFTSRRERRDSELATNGPKFDEHVGKSALAARLAAAGVAVPEGLGQLAFAAPLPGALTRAGHALAHLADDLDGGIALLDRAKLLNPNLAAAWFLGGFVRVWRGDPEGAIAHFTQAMRLSPLDPEIYRMQVGMAVAHLFAGRFDEASSWAETAYRDLPTFQVGMTETKCPSNPLGMKGCGEAGAIAAPAAVMNAITNAIGTEHIDMPATPAAVWRALKQSAPAQAA